ncbi:MULTISPECIES: PAAR domain-containing protein [unclassified Pseudomonas]|uniref:PAAR domain-containing protein n=1 Tax=unclassified Pseudomonas TaxID=196821 RepID=UPI002AC9B30D|nr:MULTISPECIES: DUF2235 domain-containing protein [unclassified Pseudomonas]MEB0044686.1 DUF2235 domain-containing protein [Pseudomonas sp. Dout3]MEB0096347.1 DUF2235 domain-containing protein [Pseudomonas sp. DC1.2]WPX59256.1 DUF2235 domain-containing protein [Pseudomonas sp. DC1.2]
MSGKAAARKTDTVSCPRCGGAAIESGSPNVFFDGLPAARVTDCTTCGSILTIAAMPSVQINGQAALVTGSQGTHGDTITGGSSTIIIGNSFTPAPVSSVSPMPTHLIEPSSYQPPITAPALTPAPAAADSVLEEEEEEEELDEEKAVGITLRIGVFFDGTLNNANNGALGLLCGASHAIKPEDLDASCKPYMSDPDSSYANDESNVKKLSDLYFSPIEIQDTGEQQLFRRLYIEGIGTSSGQEDSLMGAGMGRGATGVSAKVEGAFREIMRTIRNFAQTNQDSKIVNLTFDTFGFSRGAAAARHFANEVALGQKGPLGQSIKMFRRAFHETFDGEYKQDIQMGFIGLFDTVASVGGLDNLGYIRSQKAPGLKLYLPRDLFPKVVQLTARDEFRANFPLTRVKADHPEYTLPGAHSDIGGGYFPEGNECLLISPMQALDVPLTTDVKYTSIYRDAQQAMAQWQAKGWPAEMLEIVTPSSGELLASERGRPNPNKRVYAALQLKRPIRGELSRVYLRVMYELAKQVGVRFDHLEDSEPRYVVSSELQALCDRFVAGDYSTTPAEEQLLKLRYIHTSANWNPPTKLQGSTPRTGLVYFNAPTTDGVRVQHPHVPD